MEEKLSRLRDCLYTNNYIKEAETISIVLSEYQNKGCLSTRNKDLLFNMCHPRFLGDLVISEYKNQYEWWSFLADIKKAL